MAGGVILFVCFVFMFSAIQASEGQSVKCGRHEVETDCVEDCNTCEPSSCFMMCEPGCNCLPGFARDKEGRCIPKQFCNKDFSVQGRGGLLGSNLGGSGCPNERLCVLSCKRREFRDGICLGPGREFCNCFTVSTRPL